MLKFCSFIFRQSSEIFGTYDVISGLSFVGDGLRLVTHTLLWHLGHCWAHSNW